MPWRRTRPASTRELLRGEHRPQAGPRRHLLPLLWAALLLLGAFAAQHAWRAALQDEAQRRIAALQTDNAALAADLERQRLLAAEERATRQQLARRIDEMAGEISRLKTDLAFYRQQKPTK